MRKIMALGLIFCFSQVLLADEATDLAKQSQNPVANLISVPFNNNFNHPYGEKNQTQYELDIKPVIPLSLTKKWNLVTRTILPVFHQPNLLKPGDDITGIGDINPSFYLSPAHPGSIIYGFGPTLMLPTATNTQLGSERVSLGPSVVILTMPKNWVLGFVGSNFWSVSGSAKSSEVNFLSLQYFVNYNFKHGWFITSAPTITADWKTTSNNRWTIPFGIGGGRVFKIGDQAINASVQFYDNVVKPKLNGSDWQLQLNISLLFPEKKS